MTTPIELDFWPTPNGYKISIALEEMGLSYKTHFIDISAGDQFTPEFLALSPNNRMPAIIDPDGPNAEPISIFESGAILLYLARKTDQFRGQNERERIAVEQWLMWQMGGVGPIAGQAHHFLKYAPNMDPSHNLPYAKNRYRNEVNRLYRVLNGQLDKNEYAAGNFYSIADMAIYPWVRGWEGQEQTLEDKPNLLRWLDLVENRPKVKAGLKIGNEYRKESLNKAAQDLLFKQQ